MNDTNGTAAIDALVLDALATLGYGTAAEVAFSAGVSRTTVERVLVRLAESGHVRTTTQTVYRTAEDAG